MANLRPLRLRLLVFLGFGLAVAAVVTAGYWNFSNVQKLVEAQAESASTGRYQYLLQDVVRVVINTDNSLRQYTLDRSRKSLKAYQHAADTLETRIVKLASFPRQDDRLDSVMLWMEEKNCIMQEVAEEVKKAKSQDREALRDMFSAIRKVPNRQFTQPSIPQADPEEEGELADLEAEIEKAYVEPFENEADMLKVGELEALLQSLKPFEDEVVLAQNKAEKAEVRAVRAERLFKENPKQFR